jgi:Asp-tRNA(Asn)/Glu-tRNA(Gln) amidotransferase A subunit family amidase
MNIERLTATDMIARLKARDFSAKELAQAHLDQIARLDAKVHAWAYLDPELTLKHAEGADKKLAAGTGGVLCGLPVGIKDIFNTIDMPTQMGSPIWKGFTPGNDARIVHYLRMADAVVLGKTVTAEFAVHAPGPTANPHNLDHMPGTSSSGSAAATAAFMAPASLGTQTAGSTVRPASYCGVYGFKPSFGLIPRTGMLKTTDSLDTIGFFTRSVEDLGLIFDVIRVRGRDFPISEKALNDTTRQNKGSRPWRVAVLQGPKWKNAEPYAQAVLKEFAQKLSKLPDVEMHDVVLSPNFNRAHDIHTTIYDRTLAYYFKEEFSKHTLVSPVMYSIIERGNRLNVEDYAKAMDEQEALSQELDQFLSGYDIVLDLSTGGEALKGLDSSDRLDNCLIWTLCGVPTINLPVFTGPHGLPFGAQIFARRHNDYLLLSFARYLKSCGVVIDAPNPTPALDFAG